ncbi:MAG: hypothetical protein IJV33_10495 [Bacteroidaceae bacterium]|nr:hypothetical protein [Bacteroidaceae bacterium]
MSPYASTQRQPASLRNVALRDPYITPYTMPTLNRPSSQSCFLSPAHSPLQISLAIGQNDTLVISQVV